VAEFGTALDAALAYADRGWPVFPVQTAPNKRPLTSRGFLEATTDHGTIVGWWAKWPAAQVGVACGPAQLIAVDLDDKPDADGAFAWAELELEHGPAGCGLAMKTPRGRGEQLFFHDPNGTCRRKLGVRPGVDLLGDGGYTIVPSPASPGRGWKFGDPFELEDLQPAPPWLVELADGVAQRSATKRSASSALPARRVTPLTDAQVVDIRAALATIPNDERSVWLKMGFALKATGAGNQAYDLWTEWSYSSSKFDPVDQRRTWDAAKEAFADAHETALRSVFWVAKQHGYMGPMPAEPAPEVTLATAASRSVSDSPGSVPSAGMTLMDWQDVACLPPLEWQVEGLIPRCSLTLLAGDTEAGKSFAAIDLSMRMVYGLPWCGAAVVPGDVLYLAGEGQDGLAARFRAWHASHHHLLGEGDGGRWCLVSSEVPVLSEKTMGQLEAVVEFVVKTKGRAPSMIVIDTLSQGLLGDENDAKEVSPVLRGLVALRKRFGCTVVVIHHLVKMNQQRKKGDAPAKPGRDSVRGSGALTRNVDTALGLVVVGEDGSRARALETWKQKDGEKLPPIPLFLVPVLTGTIRSNQKPEWSCVMIPDAWKVEPKEPEEAPAKPVDPLVNEKAIEAFQESVVALVATLRRLGAVEGEGNRGGKSGNSIRLAMGRKRDTVYAAISEAAATGSIKNVGTKKDPSWVVPADSGTGGAQK